MPAPDGKVRRRQSGRETGRWYGSASRMTTPTASLQAPRVQRPASVVDLSKWHAVSRASRWGENRPVHRKRCKGTRPGHRPSLAQLSSASGTEWSSTIRQSPSTRRTTIDVGAWIDVR